MVRRVVYIPTRTEGRHNNPHRYTSSSFGSDRMDGKDAIMVAKTEWMVAVYGLGGRALGLW